MTVNIQGRMPGGDRDGLAHVEPTLCEDPDTEIVAIVRLQCREIVEKRGKEGEFVYKMAPVQIEALLDEADKSFALSQLRAAHENRIGRPSLPFGANVVDEG